ncbi:MAG: family 43 glycosylhydrolase [Lachnospiraceae bacterium]|nr:family 43 glycosylhydrolase [Lachnospiraceae bacterium]
MELLCYTRYPQEDLIYGAHMAYSMHLAWRQGDEYLPFHHNEGILYAKAVQDPRTGVLQVRTLKQPWLFCRRGGGYGVAAVRTDGEGNGDPSAEGCILLFESDDLVHYREIGLFRVCRSGTVLEARCAYDPENDGYRVCWRTEDGWFEGEGEPFAEAELRQQTVRRIEEPQDSEPLGKKSASSAELAGVEGAVPGNVIAISDEEGAYLKKKLTVPVCLEQRLTAERAASPEALAQVRAEAAYSDGGVVTRAIDWNLDPADGSEAAECGAGNGHAKGARRIVGAVRQERFRAPFAENRADPCCMYRDGKYYYIATNDADGNHTLFLRCSETLQGIEDAEETLLLDSVTYPGIGGLLWAPEFHEIDGSLYIFHAATQGEFFWEESRVMKLRDGGDPMCRADWSEPKLVVRRDGTPLCEAGKVISLDMTVFESEGEYYAMWSQRQFLPVDQGAWLYLARIDSKAPWKLTSDPVCVAKPEYSWENNHTYVVEGPYALKRDGRLMVTYSGAAIDATYAVGLLTPEPGGDLLDPANWRKSNYPLMSSRSAEGEYGTGHNSYLTDENGLVWNFYHARPGVDGPRSSYARRVHFDVDGEPMLDVTEENDLPERFKIVELLLEDGEESGGNT